MAAHTAISLWQPWATLWLLSNPDEKVFETRGWYTGVRGPLIVHAAKKRDGDVAEALRSRFFLERLAAHGLKPSDLAYGALIGNLDLVGCCRMDRMLAPSEREAAFGRWEPERFAWERGPNPTLWADPIPWKGKQGFFSVDVESPRETTNGR